MIAQTLNMMVGTRLKLCSCDPTSSSQLDVDLIGVYQNKSVMVSFPQGAEAAQLKTGDKFIVRFSSMDAKYAFRADVLQVCEQPFPYLHLQFPRGVQGVIVRHKQRVKVKNPSFKLNVAANEQTLISMSDISISGAKISASSRLGNIDDQFSIEIHNPHNNERFALPCTIRYVCTNADTTPAQNAHFDHGVRFGELENEALQFIQQVITDNMANVVRR